MINKFKYSKIIYLIITLVIILIIVFSIIHFSNNKALSDTTDILDVSGNDISGNDISGNDFADNISETEQQEEKNIMPNVIGMKIDDATYELVNNGITFYDIEWIDDEQHPGQVLEQNIPEGEEVDVSIPILIKVSSAEYFEESEKDINNKIYIPGVVGENIDDAIIDISEAGLKIGGILPYEGYIEYSDFFEIGSVVAQDPSANTEVDAGTEVILYYKGE